MLFPEDVLDKYIRAGEIAARVRERVREIVRENMPIIELCEKVESLIRSMGGKPAFPCNVSVNEVAAHYTSPPNDKRIIPENSVVKVDIGVHIDGYIADTATTVCFNPEYEDLVHAAEEALEKAVQTVRPKLLVSRLGSVIEETIKSRGYKPISNLTGHQIGRYLIHAGKSLPNISHFSLARIKAGEVYAIEPFVTVTEAIGKVTNSDEAYIFRLRKRKSVKNPHAGKLLRYIERNFHTLPFAERWLKGVLPKNLHIKAFSELLSSKIILQYPVFIEESGMVVAQAEHTILVNEKECIVTTKSP